MKDSTWLSIQYDLCLIKVALAATQLVASSDKSYREFRDDDGDIYRATDYDPNLKKRIQVPVRSKESPKKEAAIAHLPMDASRVRNAMGQVGIDFDQLEAALKDRRDEGVPDRQKEQRLQKEKQVVQRQLRESLRSVIKPTRDGRLHFNNAIGKDFLKGRDYPLDSNTKSFVLLASRLNLIDEEIYEAKGHGYSLRKRVKELTELIEKGDVNSEEVRWRKFTVESEIKYGKELDALKLSEDKGAAIAYENLLKKLKKNSGSTGRFTPLSSQDNAAIAAIPLGESSLSPKETQKGIIDLGLKEAANLQAMVRTPLNVSYGVFNLRSHAMPGEKVKDKGYFEMFSPEQMAQFTKLKAFKGHDGIVNLGDCTLRNEDSSSYMGYNKLANPSQTIRAIAFHETGHILEMKLGLAKTSAAFRGARAKETPFADKKLRLDLLNADMDHFFDPYVGVKYRIGKEDFATEVVSSGIEALSSPELAKQVSVCDRENLLYAMGVMDYAPS